MSVGISSAINLEIFEFSLISVVIMPAFFRPLQISLLYCMAAFELVSVGIWRMIVFLEVAMANRKRKWP